MVEQSDELDQKAVPLANRTTRPTLKIAWYNIVMFSLIVVIKLIGFLAHGSFTPYDVGLFVGGAFVGPLLLATIVGGIAWLVSKRRNTATNIAILVILSVLLLISIGTA